MHSRFRSTDPATNIVITSKLSAYTPYKGYKLAHTNTSFKKIEPPNIKMFDRLKRNQKILSRNDRIDLFLEGGKVSESRREDHNRTCNDRNFYKANRMKKKSQIFASLHPEPAEQLNSVWQRAKFQSLKKDSKVGMTKSDLTQLREQIDLVKDYTLQSPAKTLEQLGSMHNVSKLTLIPKDPRQFRNASRQRERNILSSKRKTRTVRTQVKGSSEQGSQKLQSKKLSDTNFDKVQKQKFSKPLFYLNPKQVSHIKADSYVVTEYPSGQVIFGNYSKKVAEIASLTKIMTFYTVVKIAEEYEKDIATDLVEIDEQAQAMTGTSAEVFVGDVYTVEQLLYGLMLPSGNDAATALAKWGGKIIQQDDSVSKDESMKGNHVKIFVRHMNNLARKIKMKSSKFMNPHGLPNIQSGSSPEEMSLLITECLKIPLFKTVIAAKKYNCWVEHAGVKHEVLWENTNKLLRRPHFIGGKTGVTATAGPCLASCYELDDRILIVVLLRTNKLSRRFKQTRFLLGLALTKMNKGDYRQRIRQIMRNDPELDSDNSEDEQAFNYERSDAKQMSKRNKILTFQM